MTHSTRVVRAPKEQKSHRLPPVKSEDTISLTDVRVGEMLNVSGSSGKLLKFQNARDKLVKKYGDLVSIGLSEPKEGKAVHVTLRLAISTHQSSMDGKIDDVVRQHGFALLFESESFRRVTPSEDGEASGLFRRAGPQYVITQDAYMTCRPERIAETAEKLLALGALVEHYVVDDLYDKGARVASRLRLELRDSDSASHEQVPKNLQPKLAKLPGPGSQ